ncbi:nitroreductase family protein [Acinetobacter johnsonii]|uniref:nitroreductase family protein n=1 Tax=Acinetobacter johnsonii TaxID=40214 RepID=UPI003D661C32
MLNIQKGEKAKIAQEQPRNDQFFDAPVGLFFAVNQALNICAKMDIAMMRNVMTSVKVQGLDTCPQAAWNHLHALVLNILDAAQFEELVCGMALGYADPKQIVNRFITSGVPVEDFAVFLNND